MSAAAEWAVVIALTAYDVVLEPVVRKAKRGWSLGMARASR